ncbi:MAG: ABC transporter permease [Theionarchaea archaeon]|nr:ABC transporter permease [Theionarchaea archaeon]MBU7000047.1 ABC transporter permease [Theionarchaea archaeon]MBU7021655.1 ABC transporter permease [Theionarchaea archaeon]MBU7034697.1 ABC transporter permease [Theionarchaea archaeon]MBU7039358.1 ABC transporter permease [Theionarchaea archaeon]
MGMREYILKRVILIIPMLMGISFIVFMLMYLMPGDAVDLMLALQPDTDPAYVAHIKSIYGLDQPWYIQYFYWLKQFATLNLGSSFLSGRDVSEEIGARVVNTLSYQLLAVVFSIAVAIPAGIVSAVKQYSKTDNLVMTAALLGVSFPIFFLGLMNIFLFALILGWLPSGGAHSTVFLGRDIPHDFSYYLDYLKHLALPTLTLGLASTAYNARLVRSSMLNVLREDYIMTARAKGLKERVVVYKHALRNAMLPVITVTGMQIALTLGGAPITETVFSWPGLGKYFVYAIQHRDYFVIVGITVVLGTLILVANVLIDISYKWLDPRVEF